MQKLAAGQSIRKTAQELGIHSTTVQEWKKHKGSAPTKRTTSNNKKLMMQHGEKMDASIPMLTNMNAQSV